MSVLYYVIHDTTTNEEKAVLGDYETLHNDTFNPDKVATCIINFVIHGKTYQDKKRSLEQMAIDFSLNQAGGLAYNQVAAIQDYFEENGRRYGLLKDFRENAIC